MVVCYFLPSFSSFTVLTYHPPSTYLPTCSTSYLNPNLPLPDIRPLSLNATPTGIPWTLNTLWTSPDPHNGTLSFRVPDSCDDVEFCTGGITLSPAHTVSAVNRYAGDAAFWLDFHNGTKDTYDAANPPSLSSDAKVWYVCDTQLNGEEHFYQVFWASGRREVPGWCGEVSLEAHYPF